MCHHYFSQSSDLKIVLSQIRQHVYPQFSVDQLHISVPTSRHQIKSILEQESTSGIQPPNRAQATPAQMLSAGALLLHCPPRRQPLPCIAPPLCKTSGACRGALYSSNAVIHQRAAGQGGGRAGSPPPTPPSPGRSAARHGGGGDGRPVEGEQGDRSQRRDLRCLWILDLCILDGFGFGYEFLP